MVKVLIADDQALVRTGFRMILDAEDDVEVTGEAADGLEAIAAARSERPDVILMDVRMPNMNGIEATRRLVDKDDVDPIRVLILTTFDLDEYVYDALRAGASGFLLKDAPPEDLVQAVRVVARGEGLIAPRSPRGSSKRSRSGLPNTTRLPRHSGP
jgi:DNA-binding NarL/FixJ family response regulator